MTGSDEAQRRAASLMLAGVTPIAVAGALVSVRGTLQNANVALILVVVIVFVAAVGGRLPGAMAAVSAAMSFGFFHTQPYLRLTIDSADDVETTLLLLIVGLAVGHLAAGRRRARRFARGEIHRMRRIASVTANGDDTPLIILAAEGELIDLLRLESCRFEAPPADDGLPRIERKGTLSRGPFRFRPEGFELPAGGVELPVYVKGGQHGRFVLEPTAGAGVSLDQRMMAVAIADQVGAALASEVPDGEEPNPGAQA